MMRSGDAARHRSTQTGEERRMHDHPEPRIGGIAVFFGFAFALFAVLGFSLSSPSRRSFARARDARDFRHTDQFEPRTARRAALRQPAHSRRRNLGRRHADARRATSSSRRSSSRSISMLYGFVIPGINNPFDHNPGTN